MANNRKIKDQTRPIFEGVLDSPGSFVYSPDGSKIESATFDPASFEVVDGQLRPLDTGGGVDEGEFTTLSNDVNTLEAAVGAIGEVVDVTFGGDRTFTDGEFNASGSVALTLSSINLAAGNSGSNNASLTGNWATNSSSQVTLQPGTYLIKLQVNCPEWTSPSADPELKAQIDVSGGHLTRLEADAGTAVGTGNTTTIATYTFSNGAARTLDFRAILQDNAGAGTPAGSGFVSAQATIIKVG